MSTFTEQPTILEFFTLQLFFKSQRDKTFTIKNVEICSVFLFLLTCFLRQKRNGKCSGDFPVKANLKYKSVGKYFTSVTPYVKDMLKGTGKTFKGPAGDEVRVTIKGISYAIYFNAFK